MPLFQSRARRPDSPGASRAASADSSACSASSAVADLVDPPAQDVADRRLPGLDAVVARHDRAVHDAADAGDVGHLLARRRDRAVAGRGADDLDERARSRRRRRPRRSGRRSRPSRSGSPRAGRASAPTPPTACPPAGRRGRRRRRGGRAGRRAAGRGGRGTPSRAARPSRREYIALWPAAQTPRRIFRGSETPARTRGDVVGQLDPARGGVEDVGRHLQAAPDLRPEPLGGVDAADGREVLGRVPRRRLGDRRGLVGAGVVLPQPGVRGEVRRRSAGRGRAAGRCASTGIGVEPVVSTPMPMTSRRENPGSFCSAAASAPPDRGREAVDVVGRVLPGEVRVLRVEQDAVVAGRVVEDGGADLPPVVAAHDEGPDRVRPVVDADGVLHAAVPPRENSRSYPPPGRASRDARLGACSPPSSLPRRGVETTTDAGAAPSCAAAGRRGRPAAGARKKA